MAAIGSKLPTQSQRPPKRRWPTAMEYFVAAVIAAGADKQLLSSECIRPDLGRSSASSSTGLRGAREGSRQRPSLAPKAPSLMAAMFALMAAQATATPQGN